MGSLAKADDRPIVISEFAAALHGRRIVLVDRDEKGSPLWAYTQAHRRMARQLSKCIAAISEMEVTRDGENWGSSKTGKPQEVADTIQDLIYRTTELLDLYLQDIPHFLGIEKGRNEHKIYQNNIKSNRKFIATICNRCKHNHRFILPVEFLYENGDRVSGFSVYDRVENYLSPDVTILGDAEAISYNWLLRKILATVFTSEMAVRDLVAALEDQPDTDFLSTNHYELPYGASVKNIVGRPKVGMPGEMKGPHIELVGQNIEISLDKYERDYRVGRLKMWMELMGHSASFRIPYSGKVEAAIVPDAQTSRPLGLLFRVEVNSPDISFKEK